MGRPTWVGQVLRKPTLNGHDDNLEFLEFSEFLNSKIPSSELSLFALYQKNDNSEFFFYVRFSL